MAGKTWEKEYTTQKHYVVDLNLGGILKLHPRYEFNEAEKAELAKPSSQRDYSVFTQEGLEELQRRREVARRIAQSPVPEWARKVQRIVTAIDDVEDLVSTGTAILTCAVIVAPALAPVLGPAIVAGEIASAAMDVANAAMCLPLGPMGTKRAAKYIARAAMVGPLAMLKPGRYLAKVADLAEASRALGKWRALAETFSPRALIGTVLEAGQAAESLFGRGLVLGPLMGGISDAFYGAVRTIKGEPVTWKLPGGIELGWQKTKEKHPEAAQFGHKSPEVPAPVRALDAYYYASELLTLPVLTGEQTLHALVALNFSSQVIDWWLEEVDIDPLIEQVLELDVKPVGATKPEVRAVLEDEGIDPDVEQTPPMTADVEPETVMDEVLSRLWVCQDQVEATLEEYEFALETYVARVLMQSQYRIMAHMAGGPEGEYEEHEPPEIAAAELVARMATWPPEGTTAEQVGQLLDWMVSYWHATGDRYWPRKTRIRDKATEYWGGYRTEPPETCSGIACDLMPALGELIEDV